MPFGPKWLQGIEWNMPNLVMPAFPDLWILQRP